MNCHGEELKHADDSHPKSKFTDPRNAKRVKKLDARQCVTCHVEHRPEITHTMGVTVPEDVCYNCHSDIADDRPSHKGMAFDTCASAGCHNFHDNRGLYEDFLAKHLDEPAQLGETQLPHRDDSAQYVKQDGYPLVRYPLHKLTKSDADAPTGKLVNANADWFSTRHTNAGVNCSACHLQKDKNTNTTSWTDKPDHTSCQQCHRNQVKGFLSGMHGMRLQQGLPAMQPVLATIPMKSDAADKSLSCTSCHTAHRFDTQEAAVNACLGCHDDKHSLAYKTSPHARMASTERVTCATCHLPRTVHKEFEQTFTQVQHNQNDNLRPNEKMLRSVCMHCHGLSFAIDALADPALITNNFTGKPGKHIQSLDLVKQRLATHKKEKAH